MVFSNRIKDSIIFMRYMTFSRKCQVEGQGIKIRRSLEYTYRCGSW